MRIIGFAGWSGSGKTTLLVRLIPELLAAGFSVSTVKHAHHDFDIDKPGKDSHTHRMVGATEVIVSSGKRWALVHELRDAAEPSLRELLDHFAPVDLVLVEGFKRGNHPKIEVHRPSTGRALLQADDPYIIAVACDEALYLPVPVLDLGNIGEIAKFVQQRAVPVAQLLRLDETLRSLLLAT